MKGHGVTIYLRKECLGDGLDPEIIDRPAMAIPDIMLDRFPQDSNKIFNFHFAVPLDIIDIKREAGGVTEGPVVNLSKPSYRGVDIYCWFHGKEQLPSQNGITAGVDVPHCLFKYSVVDFPINGSVSQRVTQLLEVVMFLAEL